MVSKKYLASKHKDIKIYTLAVDSGLNDSLFIVSCLGDAGDRSLGVEPF